VKTGDSQHSEGGLGSDEKSKTQVSGDALKRGENRLGEKASHKIEKPMIHKLMQWRKEVSGQDGERG